MSLGRSSLATAIWPFLSKRNQQQQTLELETLIWQPELVLADERQLMANEQLEKELSPDQLLDSSNATAPFLLDFLSLSLSLSFS